MAPIKHMKKYEAERNDLALILSKYELAHGRSAGAITLLHSRLKAHPSKTIAGVCIGTCPPAHHAEEDRSVVQEELSGGGGGAHPPMAPAGRCRAAAADSPMR